MACRGDLLDILEAREVANFALKVQDARIVAAAELMDELLADREKLWGAWRLVNNELAQASAEVFPEPGVQVQVDAPIEVNFDDIGRAMIEAEGGGVPTDGGSEDD